MIIMGAIILCAALALFPLLVRAGLVLGLLLACVVYIHVTIATGVALAIWLARRAWKR